MKNYYINVDFYTDVKSYRVFDINGDKAKAIEVEKKIKPQIIPGGFLGHCVNNDDFYKTNETFDIGAPFDIEQNNGVWGYWYNPTNFNFPYNAVNNPEEVIKKNPGTEVIEENGQKFLVCYKLTKTGKKLRRFRKLGKLEEVCRYYYDYNF